MWLFTFLHSYTVWSLPCVYHDVCNIENLDQEVNVSQSIVLSKGNESIINEKATRTIS